MTHPPKKTVVHVQPEDEKPVLNFDIDSSNFIINKQLEEARRNATVSAPIPQTPEISFDVSHIVNSSLVSSGSKSGLFQSNLLSELAQESAKKQSVNFSQTQALKTRSQNLHNALEKVAGYFISFTQLANDMLPDISRIYRLDARTIYENLAWVKSHVEIRKQDVSTSALISHITFTVTYRAPEIILVSRPWNQLEMLKKEISNLNLKVIDESEFDEKRLKQEWLQVHLSSDLPVYLRLQGNYEKGHIDVLSRNLIAFGISSFQLKAEDVDSILLDDIGRILLGRSDKIPDALLPN
jgi:hypothetical protein